MLCSLSNSVQCTIFNSISTIFHIRQQKSATSALRPSSINQNFPELGFYIFLFLMILPSIVRVIPLIITF